MVDREKSNQACSQGLSERLKEDRISELPDPLICHILSHLPTKEAVSTSVLSTRWKTLWLWVPKLKLDFREIRDFNAFVSFGDRFFDSSRVSWIDKLKLTIGKHDDDDGFKDTSYITSWIEAAVKRKVQHLRVDFYLRLYYEMPISLHVFEKLVSLKLFCVKLNDVEFVSFPCLKTMDLACVCLSKLSNDAFERLVSCCPVLEDLEIVHCWNVPQHLRVQSRSLKMLNIGHTFGCSQIENGQGVVIDAPLLCCLSIIDDRSKSFIVNNMEYNAKLEVDVTFGLKVTDEASISSGRSLIRSFLSGISKVGDLTIHPQTFKVIISVDVCRRRLAFHMFPYHLGLVSTKE
ncbi:PREDICTED: putative FBD-associated F-box protein At5g53635 [Camelina sativa]|uniref:FBD-associated F-box protein At5g53635 n=1 Tax=Camelina sativa TaxID=90675 RepID=A0ABM1QI03_CAMSA|nr:PREDICTED: putative FBD-associated F-box protein At5g53635 [Camelina sativa]